MNTRHALIRTAFPLLIGVGLIAVALWLFSALPAGGVSAVAPIDVSIGAAFPISPDAPQATLVISAAQRPGIIDGLCTDDYLDATVVTFNDNGFKKPCTSNTTAPISMCA